MHMFWLNLTKIAHFNDTYVKISPFFWFEIFGTFKKAEGAIRPGSIFLDFEYVKNSIVFGYARLAAC